MIKADVVIIGSGPGGTASAIKCAKAGLKVVIIEEQKFPRDRPGESLHPGIEPLLDQLGVGDRIRNTEFLRYEGIWVKWDSKPQYVTFGSDQKGSWRGFQVWRADFDTILLEEATSLGVKIINPCRALHPIVKNNRIIGVTTSQEEIHATWLIDSTGRQHWLARRLKLSINTYSPKLITRYGYVTGKCPSRDEAPAIIADLEGWTWTAKVRKNVYQWTRLTFEESLKWDKEWLPPEFKDMQRQGKTFGADMTWRRVSISAGPGYWIVGDSASVLDPASSHGVLKAIMSGLMAGNCIIEIANSRVSESFAIDAYRRWINEWFDRDTEELRKIYSLAPFTSNMNFSKEL